jgi:Methane oxygenase PmoA
MRLQAGFFIGIIVTNSLLLAGPVRAGEPVEFDQTDGRLAIRLEEKPFANYVWKDRDIHRPYFSALHARGGVAVTRTHPPVEGVDAVDHAMMHPGLWLAFGDISGRDFWRNRDAVRHVEFVQPPRVAAQGGGFAVRNRYFAGEQALCDEVCRITIRVLPAGYLIDWDSKFEGEKEFSFGDQEEMGLGVRMATPLTVRAGGEIVNSEGQRNEPGVWGKTSAWCDYSGKSGDQRAGILIMPDPKNFRPAWFHARDYGVLVANPFGRQAFTKGEKSAIVVRKGESLRLRFGILVHSGAIDLSAAYRAWLDDRQ